jgi:hypothetical protein
MPYAIRNSLILTVLLIFVIVFTVLHNSRITKEKEQLELTYNSLLEQLKNLKLTNPDYDDIDRITQEYEVLKLNDLRYGKIIPNVNNPTLSYLYLLNISDKFAPEIDFQFAFVNRSSINNINFNTYQITGTANIFSLYKFIYHLERNIILYTIERISISEEIVEDELIEGKTVPNMVSFTISFKAYFNKDLPQTIENSNLRNLKPQYLVYNPFYRRIHEPRVDPEEELYINVDYINLIGMTPDKIFIRTTNEEIVTLTPGEKVAYGYLDKIDWNEQAAIFKINKTGVYTDQTLYLNKE